MIHVRIVKNVKLIMIYPIISMLCYQHVTKQTFCELIVRLNIFVSCMTINAIIYILNIDFSEKIAPCLGPYKAYLPIIFSFHN